MDQKSVRRRACWGISFGILHFNNNLLWLGTLDYLWLLWLDSTAIIFNKRVQIIKRRKIGTRWRSPETKG